MAPDRRALPGEAVRALSAGNKIEAIKIVREAYGLGLKEAKDTVDAYVGSEPALQQKLAAARAETKRSLLRWITAVALALGAAYYLLSL